MKDSKSCGKKEFHDHFTGQCKNANDVYRFETKNQNINDDINIDKRVKKNTKQWEIEILNEFKHAGVAKELVNMVSRKKIDTLSQANKRTVFWAAYWMKKYTLRGLK